MIVRKMAQYRSETSKMLHFAAEQNKKRRNEGKKERGRDTNILINTSINNDTNPRVNKQCTMWSVTIQRWITERKKNFAMNETSGFFTHKHTAKEKKRKNKRKKYQNHMIRFQVLFHLFFLLNCYRVCYAVMDDVFNQLCRGNRVFCMEITNKNMFDVMQKSKEWMISEKKKKNPELQKKGKKKRGKQPHCITNQYQGHEFLIFGSFQFDFSVRTRLRVHTTCERALNWKGQCLQIVGTFQMITNNSFQWFSSIFTQQNDAEWNGIKQLNDILFYIISSLHCNIIKDKHPLSLKSVLCFWCFFFSFVSIYLINFHYFSCENEWFIFKLEIVQRWTEDKKTCRPWKCRKKSAWHGAEHVFIMIMMMRWFIYEMIVWGRLLFKSSCLVVRLFFSPAPAYSRFHTFVRTQCSVVHFIHILWHYCLSALLSSHNLDLWYEYAKLNHLIDN